MNLTRNIFRCFGCNASGNAADFVARMEGFDPKDPAQFRQAAIKMAEIFGIATTRPGTNASVKNGARDAPKPVRPPSTPPVKKVSDGAPVVVNAPLDFELKDLDPDHPYLAERGFRPETIGHFGLGYCNRGLMRGRVVIPLHDAGGRLVGYAGRITKDAEISEEHPKYRFPGDRERNGVVYVFRKALLLYNAHRVERPVGDLIVVEGFASVWWLWQWGYPAAVAVMGSSCSDEQAKTIVSLVRPTGRVWVMTDGNTAGEECAASILVRVAPYRLVRSVKLLPDDQPTDLTPGDLAKVLWPV